MLFITSVSKTLNMAACENSGSLRFLFTSVLLFTSVFLIYLYVLFVCVVLFCLRVCFKFLSYLRFPFLFAFSFFICILFFSFAFSFFYCVLFFFYLRFLFCLYLSLLGHRQQPIVCRYHAPGIYMIGWFVVACSFQLMLVGVHHYSWYCCCTRVNHPMSIDYVCRKVESYQYISDKPILRVWRWGNKICLRGMSTLKIETLYWKLQT